jgi:3-oxoacid CoA-transferase subunit A
MNKVFANADDAIHDISSDSILMVGGFGMCGVPVDLIDAVKHKGVTGLTVISNNAGCDGFGLGLLLEAVGRT